MLKEKIISVFEMVLLVLSIVSFSYIVAMPEMKSAEASEIFPTGCCLEDEQGATCQNMLVIDSSMCPTGLIGTTCEYVEQCQKGCCYNPTEGICSLNAPKQACTDNGGEWYENEMCEIPQCTIGCCILGEEAAETTSRECSLLSKEFNFDVDFRNRDENGRCDSYTRLSQKGACIVEAGDYSGLNDCTFTTKGNCDYDFYKGFLCTAPELNTTCEKTTNTMCVDGKDEVYFVDTCGNPANIYDASKINDEDYWTKIISKDESCSSASSDCGNCEYTSGSICQRKRSEDLQPTYGDYVCRNLNCDSVGRKHGESWCLYDYDVSKEAAAPVGSRHFIASCIEGEIEVEGCADFNQEICAQTEDTIYGFTEASCFPNAWRTCLAANEEDNYEDAKDECDDEPQCVMFLDIEGNAERYLRHDGEELAGFKTDITNEEQGASGDMGEQANSMIAHCVPKYTPGMQFWSTTESSNSGSSMGYGGSAEETETVCSLGSFLCVTKREKDNALDDWGWDDNPECHLSYNDGEDTTILLEALNERCRALGPCGSYINIVGEFGEDEGFDIDRIKIDDEGEEHNPYTVVGYNLSQEALNRLAEKSGLIPAGSLEAESSSETGTIPSGNTFDIDTLSDSLQSSVESGYATLDYTTVISAGSLGLLLTTSTALMVGGETGLVAEILTAFGVETGGFSLVSAVGWTIVWAAVGYAVGLIIGNAFGLSGPETQALANSLAAGAATATIIYYVAAYMEWGTFCGPFWWLCAIIAAVIAALVYIFTYEAEEYYILQFTCEAWEPPPNGDCDACNNDLRPCSEYRCRSIGSNCRYFTDLGEPGWCAEYGDIGSATISPWKGALSDNLTYTEIGDDGFKIEDVEDEQLYAWNSMTFGIITSKAATCRLDINHTTNYNEMAYNFITDNNTHHNITISPFVGNGSATPKMVTGENEFYIRCKNYAGYENTAEFAVEFKVDDSPDLTAPIIKRFSPKDGSYLKQGTNMTTLRVFLNEPAECKYSQEADYQYDNMPNQMACINNPDMDVFGEWVCYAELNNLVKGENDFFFKCKDQPDLEERASTRRNANGVSTPYTLNLCDTGLTIDSASPDNEIIAGSSPVEVNLEAQTSGCIQGVSQCYYKFEGSNYSNEYISFIDTNSSSHNQVLNMMVPGSYEVNIKCIDEAGNEDNSTINFNVFIDDDSPEVLRTYDLSNKLTLITDEEAICYYNQNSTIGCAFEVENMSIMDGEGSTKHTRPWEDNNLYYIKCADKFENLPVGCSIVVRTY